MRWQEERGTQRSALRPGRDEAGGSAGRYPSRRRARTAAAGGCTGMCPGDVPRRCVRSAAPGMCPGDRSAALSRGCAPGMCPQRCPSAVRPGPVPRGHSATLRRCAGPGRGRCGTPGAEAARGAEAADAVGRGCAQEPRHNTGELPLLYPPPSPRTRKPTRAWVRNRRGGAGCLPRV